MNVRKFVNPEIKVMESMGKDAYYNMLQRQADEHIDVVPPMFRPYGFKIIRFARGRF